MVDREVWVLYLGFKVCQSLLEQGSVFQRFVVQLLVLRRRVIGCGGS
jgi:hypothetical protein